MEPLRKYLGLFVLAFIGVPVLTLVIWIVGITQAVTCPHFIPNLPVTLSAELPQAAELLLEASEHPASYEPENLRQWILAASKADTRPAMLMEETGLMKWLRDDLSGALHRIYLILEGEIEPHDVELDLRPLKRAFEHPAVDRYFLEIVEHLPPATVDQEKAWYAVAQGKRHYRSSRHGLPACRPDSDASLQAVASRLRQREADVPDSAEIFEGHEIEASGIDILLLAQIVGYLLLMVPGFIIATGAFIAEPLSFRCFRWSGLPIIMSAVIVLIFAFLPKVILKLLSLILGWIGNVYHESTVWSPSLISQGIDEVGSVIGVVIDPLFSPVITTALYVGLFGVLLYGLACLSDRRTSRGF